MISEAESIFLELDKLNIFKTLDQLRKMTTKLKNWQCAIERLQIIHKYAHLFDNNPLTNNVAS